MAEPSVTADSPLLRKAEHSLSAKKTSSSPYSTHIKKQIKATGKKLSDDASIYSVYGFWDVLNLAPKMIELGYESSYGMQNASAATDDMYDWLRTPDGIFWAAITIIPTACVAAFAQSFYNSETIAGKMTYRAWQSLRDAAKGIKNAFRATKSTLGAMQLLTEQSFRHLLFPLGIIFALLSAANRIWNRSMVNARKDMQTDNKRLGTDLDNWGSFRELTTTLPEDGSEALTKHIHGFRLVNNSEDTSQNGLYYISYDYESQKAKSHLIPFNPNRVDLFLSHLQTSEYTKPLRPSILQWRNLLPGIAEKHYADFHAAVASKAQKNHQSKTLQRKSYASATYAGFIDGLYMFMGLIAVTALSAEALIAVASVSILFSACCILTRLHEEKDFQKNLRISQEKTELSLHAKEVEVRLAKLNEIQWELIKIDDSSSPRSGHQWLKERDRILKLQKEADSALNTALGRFHDTRKKLHDSHKISTTDAVLIGLRHALAIYTALVCGVFAYALISLVLFATPLPEIVALCTVAVGGLLLIGSVCTSLWSASIYTTNQVEHHQSKEQTIYQFIEKAKNKPQKVLFKEFPKENTKQESESLLQLGLDVALPVYGMFCLTDFFRSACSGILKGIKAVLLGLALTGNTENYDHTNPLIWLLIVPTAVFFAIVWASRSLAKYHKDLFGGQEKSTTALSEKNATHENAKIRGIDQGEKAAYRSAKKINDSQQEGEDSADNPSNDPNVSSLPNFGLFNTTTADPVIPPAPAPEKKQRRHSTSENFFLPQLETTKEKKERSNSFDDKEEITLNDDWAIYRNHSIAV
ncbi:MAG: hypothetical protein P1U61_01360 [Legionellaceae bacterium]|nr:hypothetical protein [Legionellaceae bacterium]